MLSNTLRFFFSSLLYHYSMLRFNCSARARFAKKEKSPNINMKRKRFPFLLHFFFNQKAFLINFHVKTHFLAAMSCFLLIQEHTD
jgi:hypothetical protein